MKKNRIIDFDIKTIKTKEDLFAVVSTTPVRNRKKIMHFFKTANVGPIGMNSLKDPVTGKVYAMSNVCFEKDGYSWSSAIPYLFEKYNIRLNEDFVKKFD